MTAERANEAEGRLKAYREKCLKVVEDGLSALPPHARRRRKWAARLPDLLGPRYEYRIWLGGPGELSWAYSKRQEMGRILRDRGFVVCISEEQYVGGPLPSLEREEISSSMLAIIVMLGEGPVAEALAFHDDNALRGEMVVYVPDVADSGYAAQELQHQAVQCVTFCLEGFETCSEELFRHIWQTAEVDRVIYLADMVLCEGDKNILELLEILDSTLATD